MRSDIVALAKQSAAGTENTTPAVYVPVTTAQT
jgi:anti-sigma factor ChrR (cupin superfamily)